MQELDSRGYRLARTALLVTGAGVLLWLAGDVLLVLFAGFLVCVFLRALALQIHRRAGLSFRISLLIVILVLAASGVVTVWAAAPRIADQVEQLSEDLPQSIDRLAGALRNYGWGRWILGQASSLDATNSQGESGPLEEVGSGVAAQLASWLGRSVSSLLGGLAFFVIAVAIGVYLAASFEAYKRGALRLVPGVKRARTEEIFDAAIHTLEGWLIGIAVSMTVLGVLSFIGLSLLGIPLAFTFAIWTALLTFIPNIGPFVSVIPPALLGLMVSPMTSLWVMLFYLILQNVEGLVITPMVQRRTAHVPPPLLLGAQLLLAVLLGFYGLLLAAPLCAAALVVVQLVYLEDRLGEPVDIPGYTPKSQRPYDSKPRM